MSYRSILVHACDAPCAAWRYALAAAIAQAEGARLSGIAFSGVTEFLSTLGAACAVAPMGPEDFTFLTDNASREREAFLAQVRDAGVLLAEASVSDESAASGLPLAARYCDLMIIGPSTVPASILASSHTVARSVLMHAPCPVMLVPAGSKPAGVPRTVMLAWDGGMAASRAVRAALPLLRRAAIVVAVCLPPQKFRHPEDHVGAALRAYLACHRVEIDIIAPDQCKDAGAALLALAEERSIDLLVMGSFGHARVREVVLGGVTETVLAEAAMPVLFTH